MSELYPQVQQQPIFILRNCLTTIMEIVYTAAGTFNVVTLFYCNVDFKGRYNINKYKNRKYLDCPSTFYMERKYLTDAGTYNVTLANAAGCDFNAIPILNVLVSPHNVMPEALLLKFGIDTALKDFCKDVIESVYQMLCIVLRLENEVIEPTTAVTIYRIVQL